MHASTGAAPKLPFSFARFRAYDRQCLWSFPSLAQFVTCMPAVLHKHCTAADYFVVSLSPPSIIHLRFCGHALKRCSTPSVTPRCNLHGLSPPAAPHGPALSPHPHMPACFSALGRQAACAAPLQPSPPGPMLHRVRRAVYVRLYLPQNLPCLMRRCSSCCRSPPTMLFCRDAAQSNLVVTHPRYTAAIRADN